MDNFHATILAIVQGITEFLPISSSGHLVLVPVLMGDQVQPVSFDIAVHFGSLIAVILFFHKLLWRMTTDWGSSVWQGRKVGESTLAWGVILGTIPIGVAGLVRTLAEGGHFKGALVLTTVSVVLWLGAVLWLKKSGRDEVAKSLLWAGSALLVLIAVIYLTTLHFKEGVRGAFIVAVTLIGFGLLLAYADFRGKRTRVLESLNWRDVMFIGTAQAFALMPGTSRAGATITLALFLGLTRDAAARFSFVLSIPAIVLASASGVYDLLAHGVDAKVGLSALLLGIAVSAATAFLCIFALLKLINRIGMLPFMVYRVILGTVIIVMIGYGSLPHGL